VRVAGSNPVVRSDVLEADQGLIRWSGREARQRPAKPCTRVQIPSPPRAHAHQPSSTARAIGAVWLARFPDTEEVTGSSPVSPTIGTRYCQPLDRGDRPSVHGSGAVTKALPGPMVRLPRARERRSAQLLHDGTRAQQAATRSAPGPRVVALAKRTGCRRPQQAATRSALCLRFVAPASGPAAGAHDSPLDGPLQVPVSSPPQSGPAARARSRPLPGPLHVRAPGDLASGPAAAHPSSAWTEAQRPASDQPKSGPDPWRRRGDGCTVAA
jgi:hypothetical protein